MWQQQPKDKWKTQPKNTHIYVSALSHVLWMVWHIKLTGCFRGQTNSVGWLWYNKIKCCIMRSLFLAFNESIWHVLDQEIIPTALIIETWSSTIHRINSKDKDLKLDDTHLIRPMFPSTRHVDVTLMGNILQGRVHFTRDFRLRMSAMNHAGQHFPLQL